jgi:hypothetical protein
MLVADNLFKDVARLDFLKCDVEGYEVYLFPQMKETIQKFKPLIQIEISEEENRRKMLELFQSWNYSPYRLKDEQLVNLTSNEALSYEEGDFYFKAN